MVEERVVGTLVMRFGLIHIVVASTLLLSPISSEGASMSDTKRTAQRLGFAEPEIKHIDLLVGLITEFHGDTPYGPYIVKIKVVEAEDAQVRLQMSAYAEHFAFEDNVLDFYDLPLNKSVPLSEIMYGVNHPALRHISLAFITPDDYFRPMAGGSIDVAMEYISVRDDDPPPTPPQAPKKK